MVTTPAVVMRPIMLLSSSVNHSARSGPAATPKGVLPRGTGNSGTTPALHPGSHRGAPAGCPSLAAVAGASSPHSSVDACFYRRPLLPRIGCKDRAYPRFKKGAPTHHPRDGGRPGTCRRCHASTRGRASPSRESRRNPRRDQRHGSGFALLCAEDHVRYARRGGRAS
jgi:hypothetical protein